GPASRSRAYRKIHPVRQLRFESRRALSLLHSQTRFGPTPSARRILGHNGPLVRHLCGAFVSIAGMAEEKLRRERFHSRKESIRYPAWPFADGNAWSSRFPGKRPGV